jgi:hypothetical protein
MSTGVIDMAIATLGVIQMVIAYQLGNTLKRFFFGFFIIMLFISNVRKASILFIFNIVFPIYSKFWTKFMINKK